MTFLRRSPIDNPLFSYLNFGIKLPFSNKVKRFVIELYFHNGKGFCYLDFRKFVEYNLCSQIRFWFMYRQIEILKRIPKYSIEMKDAINAIIY